MLILTVGILSLFLMNLTMRLRPNHDYPPMFRALLLGRTSWLLLCVCFSTVFCVGCTGTDAVFTVTIAALAGVDIVLTGLGGLISPSEASLITGAMAAITALVTAAQSAWDTYEKDPSAAGALAGLQAAVTSLQTEIPNILAGLNITNPTLQRWITTLVGLVGKLAAAIAADIIPKLAEATALAAKGDRTMVNGLSAKFKSLTKAFVDAHNVALEDSGLPPETITEVHKHFDRATKTHLGPFNI